MKAPYNPTTGEIPATKAKATASGTRASYSKTRAKYRLLHFVGSINEFNSYEIICNIKSAKVLFKEIVAFYYIKLS